MESYNIVIQFTPFGDKKKDDIHVACQGYQGCQGYQECQGFTNYNSIPQNEIVSFHQLTGNHAAV